MTLQQCHICTIIIGGMIEVCTEGTKRFHIQPRLEQKHHIWHSNIVCTHCNGRAVVADELTLAMLQYEMQQNKQYHMFNQKQIKRLEEEEYEALTRTPD
jgi:hypothetical protein